MRRSWLVVPLLTMGICLAPENHCAAATAAPPPAAPSAILPPGPNNGLASQLRTLLLESFPDPLYEASRNWGKTKTVLTGVKFSGKGLHIHADGKYQERNHGTWRKLRITSRNLPAALAVDVRDVQKTGSQRTTFTVAVAFDAQVDYQQQKWASGVRLYDASARARFRVKLTLACESVVRVENTGAFFPDTVFRLRVLQADLHYDNLVCEHLAGFGGTTAKVIGDIIVASLKKFHPSMERKFLARANAAIVKAGDTREIRISLGKLFKTGN